MGLLALIAFATLIVMLAIGTREPIYQGRTINQWLGQLDYSYPYRLEDQRASNAISQLGTNILPYLGSMLRARDSSLKSRALRLFSKQRLIKIDYLPADELQQRGSRGCRVFKT